MGLSTCHCAGRLNRIGESTKRASLMHANDVAARRSLIDDCSPVHRLSTSIHINNNDTECEPLGAHLTVLCF